VLEVEVVVSVDVTEETEELEEDPGRVEPDTCREGADAWGDRGVRGESVSDMLSTLKGRGVAEARGLSGAGIFAWDCDRGEVLWRLRWETRPKKWGDAMRGEVTGKGEVGGEPEKLGLRLEEEVSWMLEKLTELMGGLERLELERGLVMLELEIPRWVRLELDKLVGVGLEAPDEDEEEDEVGKRCVDSFLRVVLPRLV
jgi:hypothetical protein